MRIYNEPLKELWFSIQEWWEEKRITTINPEEDVKAFAIGLGFLTALALFVFYLFVRTR